MPPTKPVLSEPHSIDSSTLRAILKQHQVAFTQCTHETRCPLHDNGPVWEAQLVGITIELANIELRDPRRPAMLKKKRDLDADIAVYKLHLAQYEVQRRHIAKTIEGLKVGECVIFRDFVNMYSDANDQGTNQVKNLQLVLLWREEEGGVIKELKISNICTDRETQSCNSHYVADVFEYLLHHPESTIGGSCENFINYSSVAIMALTFLPRKPCTTSRHSRKNMALRLKPYFFVPITHSIDATLLGSS